MWRRSWRVSSEEVLKTKKIALERPELPALHVFLPVTLKRTNKNFYAPEGLMGNEKDI